MQEGKHNNYLKGAAILAAASVFAKIISAIYKIPLFNILDAGGRGAFQMTYSVFTFILAISTAGVPAALSRMISTANAKGNTKLAKRYFTVALPAFIIIGLAAMAVMFFFAEHFAAMMNNSMAAPGIRVLSPAVFFACIIAVYRGYAQGHQNMIPTAISQITEVLCKAVIGILVAMWMVSLGQPTPYISAGAITGVTVGLGISVPLLIWYKRKSDREIRLNEVGADVADSGSDANSVTIFGKIMKVSIPITLSAVFLSLMVVIDNSIVAGRLQAVLGLTELQASEQLGLLALGLTVYNLPPSIVVPVSVSIIPAIAAAIAKGNKAEAGVIMQSSLKLVSLIAMPAAAGLMVFSAPILLVLYSYEVPLAATLLTYLGAASFFVCFQYLTTAMLQANGHERLSLIAFPIGASIKIAISYFLSGNPSIGIIASPLGTLICFMVISIINMSFLILKVKERPKFSKIFLKPLICTAVMAGIAFLVFSGLFTLGSGFLGSVRMATALFLAVAIAVGIGVYGVLIVVTKTVTWEDMKLVPRGAKLAKLLRIKN